jgi:3-hydroxyisobutyrate dehydrogenase
MKVGLIGIGNMGQPIGMNLLKAKHELTIYERRKSAVRRLVNAGARYAQGPKEVAELSDAVITCLPSPDILREVALTQNGILAGAKEGDTIICMDTVGRLVVREIAEHARRKGVQVLDAPVSGGVRGAKEGTLTIMVGGDERTFKKHMNLFRAVGQRIFHVGDVGTGNIAKLANQMINLTNMIGTLEGFVLGVKAGVKPRVLYEIFKASSANSYVMERNMPRVLKSDFQPGLKLSLAHKDLGLALSLARELSFPVLLGNVAQQMFEYSKARGLGEKDETAILALLEEAAGVKVRDT